MTEYPTGEGNAAFSRKKILKIDLLERATTLLVGKNLKNRPTRWGDAAFSRKAEKTFQASCLQPFLNHLSKTIRYAIIHSCAEAQIYGKDNQLYEIFRNAL